MTEATSRAAADGGRTMTGALEELFASLDRLGQRREPVLLGMIADELYALGLTHAAEAMQWAMREGRWPDVLGASPDASPHWAFWWLPARTAWSPVTLLPAARTRLTTPLAITLPTNLAALAWPFCQGYKPDAVARAFKALANGWDWCRRRKGHDPLYAGYWPSFRVAVASDASWAEFGRAAVLPLEPSGAAFPRLPGAEGAGLNPE